MLDFSTDTVQGIPKGGDKIIETICKTEKNLKYTDGDTPDCLMLHCYAIFAILQTPT